jgi:hypothetical protein
MKKPLFLLLAFLFIFIHPAILSAKELPKIAIWDLAARQVNADYAKELTAILLSEIDKLQKYESYSQEQVRTLAGWTGERMKLGCTDSTCLTALGQMDVAKLISGSVGKIGNRFTVSLSLFDTQNARSERAVSEFCRTEDDLIELVQVAVRKLLGVEMASSAPPAQKTNPISPPPVPLPPPAIPYPVQTSPVVSANSDPGNLAMNRAGTGSPDIRESNPGWGGGNQPWQILDGIRTYPGEWAKGLAFTGGPKAWGGEACGWRQATVNFGEPRAFNRVVIWHHGPEHTPNNCKVQYWSGSNWVDAFSTTSGKNYLKFKGAGSTSWWGGNSIPMEIVFPTVRSAKVRFMLNNCDIEHGWIYEFEVYGDGQK